MNNNQFAFNKGSEGDEGFSGHHYNGTEDNDGMNNNMKP